MKDPDKGNQKVLGVQINEPQVLPSKYASLVKSKLDLDLEKVKKERKYLAKELEKVDNEAQGAKTRRKI